jgi:hypothetical protein
MEKSSSGTLKLERLESNDGPSTSGSVYALLSNVIVKNTFNQNEEVIPY